MKIFDIDREDHTVRLLKTDGDGVRDILLLSAVIIELVVMMTDHFASWTLPFRGRFTHLAFVLFAAAIVLNRLSFKQVAGILVCGILGIISYITSGDEYVIRTVVMVAAFCDTDRDRLNKILKVVLAGAVAGTLVIVVLALTGICGTVADVRDYGRGMVEARYCLGFNHANNVHSMYWYIISLVIISFRDRLKPIHYTVMLAADVLLYLLTASRTGLMCAGAVIILSWVFGYVDEHKARTAAAGTALIALISSGVLTVTAAATDPYGNAVTARLDAMLTGRMKLLWEHAPIGTWRLFASGERPVEVDNGLAAVIYTYGIIIALMLAAVMVTAIIRLYRLSDSVTLAVLSTAVIVAFMETTFIFNTSLLCNMLMIAVLCAVVHGDDKEIKNE